MTLRIVALGTLALLAACAVKPLPLPKADCVARVHSQYISSLQDAEARLAGAAAVEKPEWAPLAKQAADATTLQLELERLQVEYLAGYAPQRFALDRGLTGLVDPPWSAKDEAALRVDDPEYARLSDAAVKAAAVLETPEHRTLKRWLGSRRDGRGAIRELLAKQADDAHYFEQRFGGCRGDGR